LLDKSPDIIIPTVINLYYPGIRVLNLPAATAPVGGFYLCSNSMCIVNSVVLEMMGLTGFAFANIIVRNTDNKG
jgi:hypothetical protein